MTRIRCREARRPQPGRPPAGPPEHGAMDGPTVAGAAAARLAAGSDRWPGPKQRLMTARLQRDSS